MSLWKVSDKATQILMTEFYKNLFAMGDKQKALKDAQQYLKAYINGIYSSPDYWAVFVILDGMEN
ncbi:CHAT domain-containing protein [Parabacteroides sp. AD58]|uniref:CHAT domain-containing protein n=1 Tax=Parabacteroides absconsus TaxID=2951805 RepID=A0ABZ2ILI9_9BACT|nr:CHAT domain-containing protein [Parabacteroides sp. AD58]MCM6902134.1 CHAT domain-containing protein [Parabacteroides sp. AD58]